jgi:hypothetical protein
MMETTLLRSVQKENPIGNVPPLQVHKNPRLATSLRCWRLQTKIRFNRGRSPNLYYGRNQRASLVRRTISRKN